MYKLITTITDILIFLDLLYCRAPTVKVIALNTNEDSE
jgi:hypothetical protein